MRTASAPKWLVRTCSRSLRPAALGPRVTPLAGLLAFAHPARQQVVVAARRGLARPTRPLLWPGRPLAGRRARPVRLGGRCLGGWALYGWFRRGGWARGWFGRRDRARGLALG